MIKLAFAYAKKKGQISCAVDAQGTAQLICAFVFAM